MTKLFLFRLFLLGLLPITLRLQAAPQLNRATVEIDTTRPGVSIPDHFLGLSFETANLLPDETGSHYFRPDNLSLLNLFHTLGIKSLRIGGNTSDRDAVRLPSEADMDNLFAFARLADVKVIYCLRLYHGTPEEAAGTAKYISGRYADVLDCFSIGQEPSAYPVESVDQRPMNERMGWGAEHFTYADYRDQWRRFAEAITQAVPNVRFCGPGVHNSPKWTSDFLADFGRSNHVVLATAHQYPGFAGNKVVSPEIGREKMLSGEFFGVYQKLFDGTMPSVRATGLPFRLEEANNFYNGGARGVSDSYAAALWGLEYLHWWASHGAAGVNLHTGDRVAAGANLSAAHYTSFITLTNGITARPLAYGLKMFTLGAIGNYLPVKTHGDTNMLTIFATGSGNGEVDVTIINKGTRPVQLTLSLEGQPRNPKRLQSIELSGPPDFNPVNRPVTLGNQPIKINGRWEGTWKSVALDTQNTLKIVVPPRTATIYQAYF